MILSALLYSMMQERAEKVAQLLWRAISLTATSDVAKEIMENKESLGR